MLRHAYLSADVLLERAKAIGGHLAEFSHSNANDTLIEISADGREQGLGARPAVPAPAASTART